MAGRKAEWGPYCDTMDDCGLTHYRVAEEAGISPVTLSRWLTQSPTRDRTEVVGTAIKSLLARRKTQIYF